METPEYFDQNDVVGVAYVSPDSIAPSTKTGHHCSGVHFDCHDLPGGFSGLPFIGRRVISALGFGG